MVDTKGPLIVALDFDTAAEALDLVDLLDPVTCRVKVGKQLCTREGPAVLKALGARGFDVFLDLKFHDIPNTVAQAVRAATALGPLMLNVHTGGGPAMMTAAVKAARSAAKEFNVPRPWVLGVTVLTSLSADDLAATGVRRGSVQSQVLRLAELAQDCKLDGVVCSPKEVTALRKALGKKFKLVVPGIRPTWASSDDQKRIMTPAKAIACGADYLVIGRAITSAKDPLEAAKRIVDEIEAG